MLYALEKVYYDALGHSLNLIDGEIVSLKFSNGAKTHGMIKISFKTTGYAFYETKDLIDNPKIPGQKMYAWRDAAVDKKVFNVPFENGEYGIWVKLPSKPVKKPKVDADGKPVMANGKQVWEPLIGENGKPVYKQTLRIEGLNGSFRNDALKAMLEAAIEVKAGRFKYYVPSEKDYFHAWRECSGDEETPSGFIGVRKEDIEKLRAEGVDVETGTDLRSCANCSNCLTLFESDVSENGLPALGTRQVSELVTHGPERPCRLCMVKKEFVDIDAVDYVNDLMKYDYTNEINRYGWRQHIKSNELMIPKFIKGKFKTLVSQKLTDEGEAEKEYVREDYEGVDNVKVTSRDLIASRLEGIAEDCPNWIKADPSSSFYARPKANQCGIFSIDGKILDYCSTDASAWTAGKDFKFAIRCQGLQMSYYKKSPLERQRDFLKDFGNWVIDGYPKDSRLDTLLTRLEAEIPEPEVKHEWTAAADTFVNEVLPLAEEDTILKNRLQVLVYRVLTF